MASRLFKHFRILARMATCKRQIVQLNDCSRRTILMNCQGSRGDCAHVRISHVGSLAAFYILLSNTLVFNERCVSPFFISFGLLHSSRHELLYMQLLHLQNRVYPIPFNHVREHGHWIAASKMFLFGSESFPISLRPHYVLCIEPEAAFLIKALPFIACAFMGQYSLQF